MIFFLSINYIAKEYSNLPLIVGGDFNCRIASMNQLDPLCFTQLHCFNPGRQSYDVNVNSKGKHLVELLESYDWAVLNGRSISDTPANFSFIGTQGMSVIDLDWCLIEGFPLFRDLCVLNVTSFSDHLPVALFFDSPVVLTPNVKK